MSDENIIAIAIDLGAKNTGVFSSVYEKGTSLDELDKKQGKVYGLSKDSYTLLMNARTAKRHQRRGLDRKQLVKRLFKLVWTKQLNLEWNKDTQLATSFLLNRRGFSFITDGYSPEYLGLAPEQIKAIIVDVLDYYNGDEGLDSYLQSAAEKEGKIEELYNKFLQKNLEYKLKKLCNDILNESVNSKNLKELSSYEFEFLADYLVDYLVDYSQSLKTQKFTYTDKDGNIKALNYYHHDKYNVQEFLKRNKAATNEVLEKLPHETDMWNFNFSSFDLEKNEEKLSDPENKDYIQTHLYHFAFAVYKIKDEMASGGRHRSQYFKEISDVLAETNHQEPYLKNFCQNLHGNKYADLNVTKLVNLISNLSNLELKPLRKYFNDKAHAKADYWCEERFAETYCRWILGEWRVGSKDKDKKLGGQYCYKKLCEDLKQNVGSTQSIKNNQAKGSVIDFLLELDPCRTIPPYQDNNNRKPPKCQSLILNPNFLDDKYPEWQKYLTELRQLDGIQNYLEGFEIDLKDLKTGKKQSYFVGQKNQNKQIASGQRDYKDLDARVLQFIFDRVKVNDDLLLNEIYSHAKKIKQNVSSQNDKDNALQKLNKAISASNLPDSLKSNHVNGIFEQGAFLHLICKYYKQRQRARDSRIYIMPEYRYDKKLEKWNNTGRFDDDHQLLTYCNHKPRQKRYQLLNDLAGVLQVSPRLLVEKVGSDEESQIIEWLKGFKLASYCKSSVDVQKQYRGTLKNAIQTAIFKQRLETVRKDKKARDENKALLDKYKNAKPLIADEKKLLKLIENISKASQKIAENLGLNDKQTAKFNSLYSFAQIQQIAFAERNGNANTCAVCSVDNAHRMQVLDVITKAQRLPAIPTRIIDGAVKKMASILARNIVDDNWEDIKHALANNQALHIPIITESNAFEFEPALADVKGKSLKDKRKKALEKIDPEKIFEAKEQRIKSASLGISAYSGTQLSDGGVDSNQEELDHIVPRSHKKYGTLNDEANLICVSHDDNQKRGNTPYYLSNLANNYKQQQFSTTDSQEIASWIADEIWDSEKQDFKFGLYRSFINLTTNEQKAFRHALFLADDNPVKHAVIKAVDNRNRAFVNGTQRYFAEVLANNIYLRAKKENLATDRLSFDYFGIATMNNGRGIAEVRKFYEFIDDDIAAYAKGDKPQDSYSHLIDAMLAFCVAADEHKSEGSMGLEINERFSLLPDPKEIDKETGEIISRQDDIFSQIKVTDSEFEDKKLSRRKATEGFNNHRQMTRDGIYAESYLPILVHKKLDEVRKGFTWQNSEEIKVGKSKGFDQQQLNNILSALKFIDKPVQVNYPLKSLDDLRLILEQNNISNTSEYYYINLKTHKIHEYYIENYNTALGYKKYSKEMVFLRSLAYRTERTKINSIQDVENILGKDGNFTVGKIDLPFKCEWQRLYDKWQNTTIKNDYDFLKSFFEINNHTKLHKKVRKDFSLPMKSAQGNFLFRRKSWNGKFTYQILNNSDPRKDDVQAFVPVFDVLSKERKKGIIDAFVSNDIFMLKDDEYVNINDKYNIILDRSKWYPVEVSQELLELGIKSVCYRVDDNSRPSVQLNYQNISAEEIDTICNNALIKPNVKKDLKEQLESTSSCNCFIYKGSSFSNITKKALNKSIMLSHEASNY